MSSTDSLQKRTEQVVYQSCMVMVVLRTPVHLFGCKYLHIFNGLEESGDLDRNGILIVSVVYLH